MVESKTYRGIDLLEKILRFKAMTPDESHWNIHVLRSNPPRLIRFQQIESLLSAFFNKPEGILERVSKLFSDKDKVTIGAILSGGFIMKFRVEVYDAIFSEIKKFAGSEIRELRIHNILSVYKQLLGYKKTLRDLLTFNDGWLEVGSMANWYAVNVTGAISENLAGKYGELDKGLELIINPLNLSFTEEELVKKYNFPTENLEALDEEYY